jgi:outer membrane protein
MYKVSLPLAAALALGVSTPALANDDDRTGSVQFKALGTLVLPDGEITDVELDNFGLPAASQSEANNNLTPTIAIEYFISHSFSIETIAGVTQHDVDGRGGLAGTELVSDLQIIPATITAKAHVDLAPGIKPYVGAGPAYFLIFNEDPGAGVVPLGVTEVNLTNEFGFALQAGVDIAIGDSGINLAVDAKRYFIGTDAEFFANGTEIIRTEHELDPWVLSAGLGFTF